MAGWWSPPPARRHDDPMASPARARYLFRARAEDRAAVWDSRAAGLCRDDDGARAARAERHAGRMAPAPGRHLDVAAARRYLRGAHRDGVGGAAANPRHCRSRACRSGGDKTIARTVARPVGAARPTAAAASCRSADHRECRDRFCGIASEADFGCSGRRTRRAPGRG